MKIITLLILILILFSGCTHPKNPKTELFQQVQRLQTVSPDSALLYLEHYVDEIISPEDEAFTILLDYYINDLKDVTYNHNKNLIMIMRNNHQYKNPYEKALAGYYKGVFLMNKKDYDNGFELFFSSLQIANGLKWDHLQGMIFYKSSEIVYELGLFNRSIEYAEKSIYHYKNAGDEKLSNRAYAHKILSLYGLGKSKDASELYP